MRPVSLQIILIATALLLHGCTTPSKKRPRSKKSVAKTENLSLDQLVAEDTLQKNKPIAPPPKTVARKDVKKRPKTKPKLSDTQIASCEKLYDRFVVPYRNLMTVLPQTAPRSNAVPSIAVASLEKSACRQPGERKDVVKTVLAATDTHSQRVAMILPVSGAQAELTKHILDGFRAAFAEAGLVFDQHVIVKDTAGNPQWVEQRLAEAIFVDQATMVIGGMTAEGARLLAKWAEPLFVPTLLLSHDSSLTEDNAFAFKVYPDEKRLGYTIAEVAKANQLRRIAVLRPANQKSDQLVEFFRQKTQENQGRIVYDLVYQPDNFDSMEFVTRELFQLDLAKRGDDYRRAFQNAKRRARAAGMPFNPRNVVIDPIVDFDAVFIPDDFRMVRHFAKLFKYHGVRQIPLLGNHEWRSPALIQPPDPFLTGSYFADFIGSYNKLPPTVGAPTTTSPYFIRPEQVMPVDFRLIGYRTAFVATRALSAKVSKRRHIAPFLEKLPSTGHNAFGDGLVFDEDHAANWPTYVFRVGEGELILDESKFATAKSAGSAHNNRVSLFGKPLNR